MPAAFAAVVGPTASGKSALAMALARHLGDAEIVSADAMQVYRGMDIGTAKPTATEQAEIPHHLIDLVEPNEDFSLSRFVELGRAALADIERRGKRAIVVGGTGLYVRGLLDDLQIPGQWPDVRAEVEAEAHTPTLHARLAELDPVAAARMEPTNRRRVLRALEVTLGSGRPFSSFGPGLDRYPPIPTVQVGLRWPLDDLDRRIAERVDAMLDAGLVGEVHQIAASTGFSRTASQALGYREVLAWSEGGGSVNALRDEVVSRTRQFARRQIRWFRRDLRIQWLVGTENQGDLVRSALSQ